MEDTSTLHERVGVAHVLGLIVAAMVCVAGLALIIGAVGQLVWLIVSAVLGLEVTL